MVCSKHVTDKFHAILLRVIYTHVHTRTHTNTHTHTHTYTHTHTHTHTHIHTRENTHAPTHTFLYNSPQNVLSLGFSKFLSKMYVPRNLKLRKIRAEKD